jgi:hypothetical protein
MKPLEAYRALWEYQSVKGPEETIKHKKEVLKKINTMVKIPYIMMEEDAANPDNGHSIICGQRRPD